MVETEEDRVTGSSSLEANRTPDLARRRAWKIPDRYRFALEPSNSVCTRLRRSENVMRGVTRVSATVHSIRTSCRLAAYPAVRPDAARAGGEELVRAIRLNVSA